MQFTRDKDIDARFDMLTTLFVDLNAYFASVEQKLRPELRNRPIAVVPFNVDTTCCIAVSYEAKPFGIKTGTMVAQAKRMCPDLVLVEARPETYIRFHHRIIAAVETCLPVQGIYSVDEFSCRLARGEREVDQAIALARRVKDAIRTQIGLCIRCSIGLAPNRFLAKVGTDMQKPDGLVVIQQHELPERLYGLELIDLPGIGPRMLKRLNAKGVTTVQQLCSFSEVQMRNLWESVVGRYWWHWLRGHDLPEVATHRRSVGHQHVLGPELRTDEAARGVAVRLLHKAAARVRHLGYWARHMSLAVEVQGHRGTWHACASLNGGCQDTLTLVEMLSRMWVCRPPGTPRFVNVTLHDLINKASVTMPLFAQERNRLKLARAMDRLNSKFGRHAIFLGSMHETRDTGGGGIAFHTVPDLELVDAVG